MSSREEILASIRKHTQTRYEKPDIADMNNDGKVTNVDVSALLDLVTKGS